MCITGNEITYRNFAGPNVSQVMKLLIGIVQGLMCITGNETTYRNCAGPNVHHR